MTKRMSETEKKKKESSSSWETNAGEIA